MKSVAMEIADDSTSQASDEQPVSLQIYVPELLVQKCLQFSRDEMIWDVKQQILSTLPKELKEGFNYGLFCPPVNGKAGKFLDEERPLADYPFSEPSGYLELRYKRRIYKMMTMEEKQLKQLHTRANLRRMLDHVNNGHVEKITKMCTRGLDPNFHCSESGESPLTLTANLRHPAKVIMALVNGGAHLDFRTKDGCTALHRVVEKNNLEALKTLLDLGASPNYKDMRGLTPLYYSVLYNSDSRLAELLLHDHATIGSGDPHGWQEVHQACKYGLVQHLEHLLFYGADMNARNASGNTPLHVCAVNDQESCARVLLFRGSDKGALNYANQNPHQVAVIAGNLRLADIIKNHKPEDVEKCDSSGVCTSNSVTNYDSSTEQSNPIKASPLVETVCVCVEDYIVDTPGHLLLKHGELVEVTGVDSTGFLEGRRRDGEEGLFLASCVQEVQLRPGEGGRQRVDGRKESASKKISTASSRWKMFGDPRTVILHKGKKGFGFVLRGAKATSPLMERQPTEFWPSLQYLDDVDKGGVAEMAGLKKGDFLLEINGQDVSQASHEHVVAIIRQSGDLVAMTVVTVQQHVASTTPTEKPPLVNRQCATLPRKLSTKKAPLPPKRDPRTTLSVGRARARSMVAGLAEIEVLDHTLNEYDSEGRSTKSSSIESIPNKQVITPADNSNQKIASIRSRPSSRRISVSELEDFLSRQGVESKNRKSAPTGQRFATVARMHKVYGSAAAMKRLREFHKEGEDVGRIHRDFHSTPELSAEIVCTELPIINGEAQYRRSRSQEDMNIIQGRQCRHSWACPPHSYSRHLGASPKEQDVWKSEEETFRRSENATPTVVKVNGSDIYAETIPLSKPAEKPTQSGRASCPPPSYPPPPPPVGQVVKVDVSRALGEYANLTMSRQHKAMAIMSSFRPGDSAKLYASPDSILGMGYNKEHLQKCDATLPRHLGRGSSLRSHSLPPKMPGSKPGVRSATSSDAENSGDSGVAYPGFRTTHRQRDTNGGHVSDKGTVKPLKGKGPQPTAYGTKFPQGNAETGSPKHYPPLTSHSHEPFIPEPDYESSEDEEDRSASVDTGGKLVTFKALTPPVDCQINGDVTSKTARSPHSEAKRAIHAARERLNQQAQKLPEKISQEQTANEIPLSAPPQLCSGEKSQEELCTEEIQNSRDNVNSRDNRKKTPVSSSPSSEDDKYSRTPVESEGSPSPLREFIKKEETDDLHQLQGGKSFKDSGTAHKNVDTTLKSLKEGNSPQKTLEKPARLNKQSSFNRENSTVGTAHKVVPDSLPLKEMNNKEGEVLQAKTAPAVPTKPKHDVHSHSTDDKTDSLEPNVGTPKETSPGIEVVSRSVKENIYTFEKRSEMAKATTFSPRRKSDGIRIALMGNQSKSTDGKTEEKSAAKVMKTSKSCPKTFNEEDSEKTDSGVSSDTEPQMERISTPAQPLSTVSDVTSKKPPDAPPKMNILRRIEDYNKQSTLGRRSVPDSGEARQSPMTGAMTLNRQSGQRRGPFSTSTPPPTEVRTPTAENIFSNALKMKDADNIVDHAAKGTPLTTTMRAVNKPAGKVDRTQDDECLRLCQRVDKSLQLIRLQVDSLGLAAVNEVDVLAELVPPPPEFSVAAKAASGRLSKERVPEAMVPLAPPPEFSDESPAAPRIKPHPLPVCRMSSSSSDSPGRGDIHSPNYTYLDYSYRATKATTGSPQHGPAHKGSPPSKASVGRGYEGPNNYSTLPNRTPPSIAGNRMEPSRHREFRQKPLHEWSGKDVSDWLESLFLPEYKPCFAEAGITGSKLANMDNNDLMGLGVKQAGHRMNMERSIKWYLK